MSGVSERDFLCILCTCSPEQPSSRYVGCRPSSDHQDLKQDSRPDMRWVDGHLHQFISYQRPLQLSHALSRQLHVHALVGLALVNRRRVAHFLDGAPEFHASEDGGCCWTRGSGSVSCTLRHPAQLVVKVNVDESMGGCAAARGPFRFPAG